MSMVEKINILARHWTCVKAANLIRGADRKSFGEAIAAALAEAEKVEAELARMDKLVIDMDAEWKRAREAWCKIDSQLARGGDDDPGDILDQFFGGGWGEE